MAAVTGSLGLLALESGLTAAISVFGRLTARIRAHAVMYGHGCFRSEPTIRLRALHKASPVQYSVQKQGRVKVGWLHKAALQVLQCRGVLVVACELTFSEQTDKVKGEVSRSSSSWDVPWFQECRLAPEWLLREVKGEVRAEAKTSESSCERCTTKDRESQQAPSRSRAAVCMRRNLCKESHCVLDCYHAIRSARFSFLCAVGVKAGCLLAIAGLGFLIAALKLIRLSGESAFRVQVQVETF